VRRLGAIVESVAAVLLAVVVVIVLVQVFGRYVLRISLTWPEELARYVLVWLMFFGVAAAAATRSQIVVDTLVELVSPRVRRVLEWIGALAGVVAVGVLVWTSQPLFGPASRSTSPATGIPSFWIYLAIPVGGALLGLFALADLGRLLGKEPPPSGGPGAAAGPSTSAGPGPP
jgi:TRAP-type C4-dicarboxylate transport system permease small subunit